MCQRVVRRPKRKPSAGALLALLVAMPKQSLSLEAKALNDLSTLPD
jgi:hypothetical protein